MGTVSVPLNHGEVALLDEEDVPLLGSHKWRIIRTPEEGPTYAVAWDGAHYSKRKLLRLHRLVMDAPDEFEVDHINGNGLDNRRCNLRLATRTQNSVNVNARRRSKTGYKGVYWKRSHNQYEAQLRFDGRLFNLGYHRTPEEAARAYDAKAKELHGDFARLNFP